MTDYFVICSGDVDQHVRAIVRHIEDQVKSRLGERVLHREGLESLHWVLLDYVNVVVHVFRPSFREFYGLEDLWSDAHMQRIASEKEINIRAKAMSRKTVSAAPKKTRTAAAIRSKPRDKATEDARATGKVSPKKDPAKKVIKKTVRKKES